MNGSCRFIVIAAGAAILSNTSAMSAEGHLCQSLDVYSSGEFREAHAIDIDGEGTVSAGDKRIGHRVLQDTSGAKIGDRYYATTIRAVDEKGYAVSRFTETVNIIADGAIFTTKERIGGKDMTSKISGGTGRFAGARGTVSVERDGSENIYHFQLTCEESFPS